MLTYPTPRFNIKMREPMHKLASGMKCWLFLLILFVVIFQGCYSAVRLYNKGNEKFRSGNLDGAIEDYNQAIEINPGYASAYYNRGIAYEDLGDSGNALMDYTKAIEINPDYVDAYINRGSLLLEEGDFEGAIKDFTHAIRTNPYHATAYFNRGSAWRGIKEYKNAIEDFKRAMELDPAKKEKASAEIKFCESRIKDLSL
jgi:tetratricopeptide (TPR) repeat protein